MTGKTHIVVGTTAALCLTQPDSFGKLILCLGTSIVGAVISDVDVVTSKSRKGLNKISIIIVTAVISVLIINYFFNIGIEKLFTENSNFYRLLLGIVGFIAVCTYGKKQPHRSFMHSLLACAILSGILYLIFPSFVPYFAISMLSHIFIDLFNKKGVKLLYPLNYGISFDLCIADGIVNKILFTVCSISAIALTILSLFRCI